MSMALTLKMLSLQMKIDDIINLQTKYKQTFSNICKLCTMVIISISLNVKSEFSKTEHAQKTPIRIAN